MANFKDIFKIILVVQLLVSTLATYGHPDAESIDFGSPTQPSRDQLLIDAAIKRGMDGEAVAELLRTKKPVVKTTTTPGGLTKTTTYKLEPDGSISSKSVMQQRHRYVYNSDSVPDEIKNSPTGTVTKTFTDSDGNKVTQTVTVNRDRPILGTDADDLSGNWFSQPFPSWPEETPSSPPFSKSHRTLTRTFSNPHGDRRTIQLWSSDPEFSDPDATTIMKNNTPNFRRTSTTTHIKPNGEKHEVQTISTNRDTFHRPNEPKFPSVGDPNWPNFDYSTFSKPWDNLDPDNLDGWELVKDPEVTTKKLFETWTPKSWNWPEFPTHPTTTTTTTTPKLFIEPEPTTRKPLPNLDDFLRTQYGRPSNRESTTNTLNTPKSIVTTTTPKSFTTTPKFIQIEDLPVVEVLHNGKPADENILKSLPPHLTPRTTTGRVINVEHKHPVEEDIDVYTPRAETNVRSYSATHIGPEKPRLKDLDPQMQDILKNAGIVPEIEGDSITKTRTESDGRVITTTYKVSTVPSPPNVYMPTVQHYVPPHHSYKPSVPSLPHLSPISEFLAQLGLTKFDITSRNGHYSKTFIDENGDVLTATFVLSSPRGVRVEENSKDKPLK